MPWFPKGTGRAARTAITDESPVNPNNAQHWLRKVTFDTGAAARESRRWTIFLSSRGVQIMSHIQNSTKKHQAGKLVMNIGGVPALLAGGLLLIGGLYLSLSSLTIQSDNSWIDRAGFGAALGIVALIPGVIMLGLWYLSRIGPRNTTMTMLGASINLLIGLAGVIPLVNGSFDTNLLAWILTVISPVFLVTGLSSFLGWWLQDMFGLKQGE